VVPFHALVDQYTLLTIHPGFQGQELLPESLNRVGQLKTLLPGAVVEVDGGVSARTIVAAAQAGADFLVVGSALREDPVRSYGDLQSILAEGVQM
jgi:ribulose-phosphate 3-epimerase